MTDFHHGRFDGCNEAVHYNEEFYFSANQRFQFNFTDVSTAVNDSFTAAGIGALITGNHVFVVPPTGHD